MLQGCPGLNPIKDILSASIDENVIAKTYNICKGLEEAVEPLRYVQKMLGQCIIGLTSSSNMLDKTHNPLFEKRLCNFRNGSSCLFPKHLLNEVEQLYKNRI